LNKPRINRHLSGVYERDVQQVVEAVRKAMNLVIVTAENDAENNPKYIFSTD